MNDNDLRDLIAACKSLSVIFGHFAVVLEKQGLPIPKSAPVETKPQERPKTAPASASLDDVKTNLKLLMATVGKEAVATLLKKYGASKLKELKPEHYGEINEEAILCLNGNIPF